MPSNKNSRYVQAALETNPAPLIRLVALQGPTQALSAIAGLRYENELHPNLRFEDHLVIHGLYTPHDLQENIYNATLEMANVWSWKTVTNLTNFERKVAPILDQRSDDNPLSYDQISSIISPFKKELGLEKVDILHLCRNFQPQNQLITHSYKDAYIVAYGDALGLFDCKRGPLYVPEDEARLILPLVYDRTVFDNLNLNIIPKHYATEYLNDIYNHAPKLRQLLNEISLSENENSVLITPSPLSEWKRFKLEDEIEAYLQMVLENTSDKDVIFIKPHPRQVNNQHLILNNILRDNLHRKTVVLDGPLSSYPVEVLHQHFNFDKVISFLSASGLGLKFFYNVAGVHGLPDSSLAKLLPIRKDFTINDLNLLKRIHSSIDEWDGISPLCMEENIVSPMQPNTADNPRMSVIVPTHRNPELLKEVLDSMSKQTLSEELYEVIVVDNDSQDETPEITAKYPQYRYVLETTLGLNYGRNRGVNEARGDIIVFTDDDVFLDPNWLEELLKVYDTYPDAWAVGGKLVPIWDAPQPAWLTERHHRSLSLVDWGNETRPLIWPERVIGANFSFRKVVFEQMGMFDPALDRVGSFLLDKGDVEVQMRIVQGGKKIYYTPYAIVHHHVPASRMTHEYFKKRSEGSLLGEKIIQLRSEGRHDEVEQILADLRNSENNLRSGKSAESVPYFPTEAEMARSKALIRSRQALSEYKNRHQGERCVIVGNGPSLNKMNLDWLADEITFGMNKIYMGFDRWNWRPTYHVAVNPLVLEQSADRIGTIGCPHFLSINGLPYLQNNEEVIFLKSKGGLGFSEDLRLGMWEGHTVTYVAMQLAFFMGFKEVALIGVDHNFAVNGPANKEVVADAPDDSHFDPNYFGPGTSWNLPDLEKSEQAYHLAKATYERHGRRLVNATVGGKLEIFPRVNYQEWHSSPVNKASEHSAIYNEALNINLAGEEYFLKGDLANAEKSYLAALNRMPDLSVAHNNLGVLAFASKDNNRAIKYLQRAAEIDPLDRDTLLNIADVLLTVGQKEIAHKCYQEYFKLFPDDYEVQSLIEKIE